MKNAARSLATITAVFATRKDWVVDFPAELDCACCGTARIDRDTLPESIRALTKETDSLAVTPYGGALVLCRLYNGYDGGGKVQIATL
jgi:hypothetical protein